MTEREKQSPETDADDESVPGTLVDPWTWLRRSYRVSDADYIRCMWGGHGEV